MKHNIKSFALPLIKIMQSPRKDWDVKFIDAISVKVLPVFIQNDAPRLGKIQVGRENIYGIEDIKDQLTKKFPIACDRLHKQSEQNDSGFIQFIFD